MRRVLPLVLTGLLTGCVQTWGLAPPPPAPPPPPPEEAAPSDAEVERLLALATELETQLAELEARIAAEQAGFDAATRDAVDEVLDAQEEALEERLRLVVAIAELRRLVDLRRASLARGDTPPPELVPETAEAYLAQADELVDAARERLDQDELGPMPTGGLDFAQPEVPRWTGKLEEESEGETTTAHARGGKKRRRKSRRQRLEKQKDPGDALLDLIGVGDDKKDEARVFGGEDDTKSDDKPGGVEGAAVVGADPTDFDVVGALQPALPTLMPCVERRARVTVKGRLAPDGRFREVRIADGELTPGARACLVDRLQQLRLDVPTGMDAMVVSFPLTFDGR